jgi:hypothetical protein
LANCTPLAVFSNINRFQPDKKKRDGRAMMRLGSLSAII